MKPIRSDFSVRAGPPRWGWRAVKVGLVLLVVGAAGVTWQWRDLVHLRAAHAVSEVDRRARASEALEVAQRPRPQPPYEASARSVLAERLRPWPTALQALESIQHEGVSVESFELGTGEQMRVVFSLERRTDIMKVLDELNTGYAEATGAPFWRLVNIQSEGARTGGYKAVVLAEGREQRP